MPQQTVVRSTNDSTAIKESVLEVNCAGRHVRQHSACDSPACATASANGETDPRTKLVSVRADLAPAQACKTAAHELAHIHLGPVDDLAEYRLHRGRMEVEAESVAFLIAAGYGLDAADYSVSYSAHWANGDVQVIRETAERVIAAARALTSAEPVEAVA